MTRTPFYRWIIQWRQLLAIAAIAVPMLAFAGGYLPVTLTPGTYESWAYGFVFGVYTMAILQHVPDTESEVA